MKKILFTLITLCSLNILAQNSSRNLSQKDILAMGTLKFKASDASGIFYYDIDNVIKKVKIKDAEKQSLIKEVLKKYNEEIKIISQTNKQNFSDIDVVIKSMESTKDPTTKSRILKKVEGFIKPIKSEVELLENELNLKLKNILSEKQNKKWLKFQNKEKEKRLPAIGVKRVLRSERQVRVEKSWN